jgi:hypothetical protein
MSDLNRDLIEQLLQRIDLLEKEMKHHKKKKMADKDYDKDGKVESSEDEYLGSRDRAIKKAKGEKIEEALDRIGGNVNNNSPSIRSLASKIEKSDLVEKVLNKLDEMNSMNKKSFKDQGTRVQLSENLVFGGFPRTKLNEQSANLHQELEKHMSVIGRHGQMLHDTDNPNRYKFGKIWSAFSQGKFDNADELIKMGADAEAIGNYIKIATSPEYKEHMAKVRANISPESMGYGAPGSPSRRTGD